MLKTRVWDPVAMRLLESFLTQINKPLVLVYNNFGLIDANLSLFEPGV